MYEPNVLNFVCLFVFCFRLLGQQVQTDRLTFAADVWGAKKIKEIQRVRVCACKKVLPVSQKTPNTVSYGELVDTHFILTR